MEGKYKEMVYFVMHSTIYNVSDIRDNWIPRLKILLQDGKSEELVVEITNEIIRKRLNNGHNKTG